MSTLKVNKIQPNSSNHISIDGNTTITGSLTHNGATTLSGTNLLEGSTVFKGTTTVEGDLTVGGTLTAQEVRTEFDNASVVFEDGSTKFGDTSDDNHGFTGSLGVQGGEFKVTNQGDDVLVANPLNGSFVIGDTQRLGDGALITGDSSTIKIKNDQKTVLTANSNFRIGIGTASATATLHVDHPSYAVGNDVLNIGVQGNQIAFMNNSGDFMIGDKDGVGDGGYISHDSENFKIFSLGGTEVANFNTNEVKLSRNLLIKAEAGNDATLTIEADPTNTDLTGENDNPSILFKQDGGSENAAVGFNIIDDTSNGTVAGTGNRFWIVNAIDDNVGDGGITFGTAQVDGWDNAIARFMIRGDGKGLFGHPNDHYDKVLGSQFEVYDDRTENTTSDYTLAAYGYVDVSEYPPSQGAGGIISRLKVVNGATDLGTHAIGMVAGTTTSEILTTGDFAFYAGSDMDTSGATGFAGLIHSGSSNWQIGGTGGTDTDTGYKLTVVGTSKFNSDVIIGGNLQHSGSTSFKTSGKGIVWSMNTDGASIKFYNTGDGDTDSRLEFNTRDNNNEYFKWTHTTAGGTYESMRLDPINSGSQGKLTVNGEIYSDGLIVGNRHSYTLTHGSGSSILGGQCQTQTGLMSAIVAGLCNDNGSTYGMIGAGYRNCNVGNSAIIGAGNNNCTTHANSAIVAGASNSMQQTGCNGMIGSGESNLINYSCFSFIGAGSNNRIDGASQSGAAIVGGLNNTIESLNSCICNAQFIGGGDSNKTAAQFATIAGGQGNIVEHAYGVIAGGKINCVRGNVSTVVGGQCNTICSTYGIIGGGFCNRIETNSAYSTIAGGSCNQLTAGQFSSIGGGIQNTISQCLGTIAGGRLNRIEGSEHGTIGGGYGNCSQLFGHYSTIGGGINNIAACYAFVGGGSANCALCQNTVIAGGSTNKVSAAFGGILGGLNNEVTSTACNSFIIGSHLTVNTPDTTAVNNLLISGSSVDATGLLTLEILDATPTNLAQGSIFHSGSAGAGCLYFSPDGSSICKIAFV
jgi:hypothetical protein